MERQAKIEATRQFVLTTCVIAGALAAFLIPVLNTTASNEWQFTIISFSIFFYLWTIGQGILHILFLYLKELYSSNISADNEWKWKFELNCKVHGQFSLFILGVLFSFGIFCTIAYLIMGAWGHT